MDIRDITSELISEIWEDYSNGDCSFIEISKKYGFYWKSLSKKMRSLGMKIVRKGKSGKALESKICKLYLDTNLDCVAVSRELKVSDDIVRASLRRANIKIDPKRARPDYNFNIDFFAKESQERDYIFGLFYADGCNVETYVSITLQEKDIDILEKINILTESNRPLIFKPSKSPNHQNCWLLTLGGRDISKLFYDIGCPPRKSLILKFPSTNVIRKQNIHHFIRGYMDGDGCICNTVSKTGRLDCKITITSTYDFASNIQKILREEINVNSSISIGKNKITCDLKIGGNGQSYKFLKWVYKDAAIFMNRKNKKALEFIKEYESSPRYIKKRSEPGNDQRI